LRECRPLKKVVFSDSWDGSFFVKEHNWPTKTRSKV